MLVQITGLSSPTLQAGCLVRCYGKTGAEGKRLARKSWQQKCCFFLHRGQAFACRTSFVETWLATSPMAPTEVWPATSLRRQETCRRDAGAPRTYPALRGAASTSSSAPARL